MVREEIRMLIEALAGNLVETIHIFVSLPDRWRCLFAAALYTGMRKGELLGLRKEDVDLAARLITIRRSHDRDTTKGGHADAVPIAVELAPYLEVAMAESRTDLVSPAATVACYRAGSSSNRSCGVRFGGRTS
jgi:integrase